MTKIKLEEPLKVGSNSVYVFAVGKLEGRWVGFAQTEKGIFIFPQITQGHRLGLPDRDRAILLTGAIAQDYESAYGGIEEWSVPVELRGDPDALRCRDCDTIGCDGDCEADNPFDDDEDREEAPDLGPCCACEKVSDSVRNIIMLPYKNPEPDSGWGCMQCGLPSDGATAVVCDECVANKTPIKFAAVGYLKEKKRISVASLGGTHEHDMSKHPERPPTPGTKRPCERCSCCQETFTECEHCEGNREIGIEDPTEDDMFDMVDTLICPSCEGDGGYWLCERNCELGGKHLNQ